MSNTRFLAEYLSPDIGATHGYVLDAELYIDWDFDDVYTDESAYLLNAAGQIRLAPPESSIMSPSGIVDRCTVLLDNSSGRFSPLNTGGALYSNIQDGGAYHAPMYMTAWFDADPHTRIFTGVIKIPKEAGSTTRATATVSIDCRSNDEQALTKRLLTTNANFTSRFDTPQTESEHIADILEDIGFTSGDYTLDDGLFIVPWVWLDNDSPIEECWKLAAACGGRFYATPDDKFVYENATHWLTGSAHTLSQATLDENDFQSLEPFYNDRELYESVTVEAQPREIETSDTIWEADDVYIVPANTTGSDYITVWAELDDPAYTVDSATYDANTSGGIDISGSVSLTQTDYAQRIKFQFQNSHSTSAAEIHNLTVTGTFVKTTDKITSIAEYNNTFWDSRTGRGRLLTGNRYIQTQAQLNFLSEFLRDRHQSPRLFWRVKGVRGQSGRRLGDRLTVGDNSIFGDGTERDMFLIGIDWRLSSSGFWQDYLCVDATTLYQYIDTDPDYFVINTDKLGSGSSPTGRVFY